jgi:acyl carrier protein
MNAVDQIRRFIAEHFFVKGGEAAVSNDMSFLESRIMDSTGVLEFVAFLESTFQIRVEDEDLTPENLDSVPLAAAYVERKLQAAPRST